MSSRRITSAVRTGRGLQQRMSGTTSELFDVMSKVVADQRALVKDVKAKHGNKVLSTSTVDACYMGMRGLTAMVYEPSLLDANEGIRFRGLSIEECNKQLPKFQNGTEMMPEGMLWLLLTGSVPTQAQVEALSADIKARAHSLAKYSADAERALDAMPKTLHPMSQLVAGVAVLQSASVFAKKYNEGVPKTDYWKWALEDTLNVTALLPRVCAKIYRRTFHDGVIPKADEGLDWTGQFTQMLGFRDPKFAEAMRMYLSIHVDHEGGNVSAHATHLVGSTLADPFLSYAGGMCGLAGPLHGLANQECLEWLNHVRDELVKRGSPIESTSIDKLKEEVTKFAWETLNAHRVIPGFGHAVLRKTDPRYTAIRNFCSANFKDFPLFKLCDAVFQVIPDVLTKHGKTQNPYPNVDAHSGVLLQYYGLTQQDYYTVLFGLSRALGVLSANVHARALGMPIERPKSVTTEWIVKKFKDAPADEPAQKK